LQKERDKKTDLSGWTVWEKRKEKEKKGETEMPTPLANQNEEKTQQGVTTQVVKGGG